MHGDNFGVNGIEKVRRQLDWEGHKVGGDRVARLMTRWTSRAPYVAKGKRIATWPAEVEARLADLLERTFTVPAPNRLCMADLTYVSTSSGFVYVAFVIDAYSRAIVGWRISNPLPLPEDFRQ